MQRPHLIPFTSLFLLLSLGCQPAREDASQSAADMVATDYAAARDAYWATEDIAERARIARDFVGRYPETERAVGFVERLVSDTTDDTNRPELAYELIDLALPKITDPELRFEIRMQQLALHGKTGKQDALRTLAGELASERDLRWERHYEIVEAATEGECWELALAHSDAALAWSNPAAYKEDHPDDSDAEAVWRAERRNLYARSAKGWALANLDRTQEALATFRKAGEYRSSNIVDVDHAPLDRYWAMALLRQGDPAAAMTVLAEEAAFGWEPEVHELYRQAYVAVHGSDEGLEAHRRELRTRLGKVFPDFALANYDGEIVRFSDFRGDLVLLTIWDPG